MAQLEQKLQAAGMLSVRDSSKCSVLAKDGIDSHWRCDTVVVVSPSLWMVLKLVLHLPASCKLASNVLSCCSGLAVIPLATKDAAAASSVNPFCAGVKAKVIYSGGMDLDILPQQASKGKGLEFLLKEVCNPAAAW